MAEYEELVIRLRTDEDSLRQAKEIATRLKEGVKGFSDLNIDKGLEGLGRGFKELGKTVEGLFSSVEKGPAALAGLASRFGAAGIAIGALAKIATGVVETLKSRSEEMIRLQQLGDRIRMHPAQIKADVEAMVLSGIDRDRALAMEESFAKNLSRMRQPAASGERRQILTDLVETRTRLGGRFESMFDQILRAPTPEEAKNLSMQLMKLIQDAWKEDPTRGAAEREKFAMAMFGLPDIMNMKTQFKAVSDEMKSRWDVQLTAAKEFDRVVTEIKIHWDELMTKIETTIMAHPLMTGTLKDVLEMFEDPNYWSLRG